MSKAKQMVIEKYEEIIPDQNDYYEDLWWEACYAVANTLMKVGIGMSHTLPTVNKMINDIINLNYESHERLQRA